MRRDDRGAKEVHRHELVKQLHEALKMVTFRRSLACEIDW